MEKILAKNSVRGEKMTNIRYADSIYMSAEGGTFKILPFLFEKLDVKLV